MENPKRYLDNTMSAMRLLVGVCMLIPFIQSHAQVLDIRPGVSLGMTYSDNLDLGSDKKRSGWLTELSPTLNGGLKLSGGRGSANFDVGFRNFGYESGNGLRKPSLSLQAIGEIEAVEDFIYIQANSMVQRTSLSPFSGRASADTSQTSGTNETRSLTIAPRAEFSIGSFANARLEQRVTRLSGGANSLNAQNDLNTSLNLNGARAFGPLGWGLAYRRNINQGGGGVQKAINTSTRLTLTHSLSDQLALRGVVGREFNQFGGQSNPRTGITGVGVDWNPSARTSISGTLEDRFFGNGYDLNIRHRMARSTFLFSLGNDYSTTPGSFESIYTDPQFLLLFENPNAFRSDLTDPALREQAVRDELQYARTNVITNAQFTNKSARFSYTLSGIRNTLSFSYSRSQRNSISSNLGLRADDIFRDASSVTTETAFLGFDHRLTPKSGLRMSITQSISSSNGAQSLSSRRSNLTVGFDTSLGHRTFAILNFRHERLSGLSGFSENTLAARISMRF